MHKFGRLRKVPDLQRDRICAPHAIASDEQPLAAVIKLDRVRRRVLLGGLIHEYKLAA
ncbi:MAG: hypothetical protein LC749_20580 [Actinobacteria bacterium]|nr:hypothetical protein [Actinomycetota bacterium]